MSDGVFATSLNEPYLLGECFEPAYEIQSEAMPLPESKTNPVTEAAKPEAQGPLWAILSGCAGGDIKPAVETRFSPFSSDNNYNYYDYSHYANFLEPIEGLPSQCGDVPLNDVMVIGYPGDASISISAIAATTNDSHIVDNINYPNAGVRMEDGQLSFYQQMITDIFPDPSDPTIAIAKLRQDMYWSDGEPITADDFVFG